MDTNCSKRRCDSLCIIRGINFRFFNYDMDYSQLRFGMIFKSMLRRRANISVFYVVTINRILNKYSLDTTLHEVIRCQI